MTRFSRTRGLGFTSRDLCTNQWLKPPSRSIYRRHVVAGKILRGPHFFL